MLTWLYRRCLGVPRAGALAVESSKFTREIGDVLASSVPDRYKGISNRFTYHAPTEQQIKKYGSLRTRGKELAFLIEDLCPDSEEKTTALTRLDEVIMHANAAIARHTS